MFSKRTHGSNNPFKFGNGNMFVNGSRFHIFVEYITWAYTRIAETKGMTRSLYYFNLPCVCSDAPRPKYTYINIL